jgi:hypothetical protein
MRVSCLIPPLVPGIQARTRAVFPYPLPRGLEEGIEVTVDQVNGARCIVHDDAGRKWSVPAMALDTGKLIWEHGHWVPAPLTTSYSN